MGIRNYEAAQRASQNEPLQFTLYGNDLYTFHSPGTDALVLDMIQAEDEITRTRALFDWLGQGLEDDQEQRLIGRVRDPKDPVDLDLLTSIVNDLIEDLGGNPTGGRPA